MSDVLPTCPWCGKRLEISAAMRHHNYPYCIGCDICGWVSESYHTKLWAVAWAAERVSPWRLVRYDPPKDTDLVVGATFATQPTVVFGKQLVDWNGSGRVWYWMPIPPLPQRGPTT